MGKFINAVAAVRKPLTLKPSRPSTRRGKGKIESGSKSVQDKENLPANSLSLNVQQGNFHPKLNNDKATEISSVVSVVDREDLRKRVEAVVAQHLAERVKEQIEINEQPLNSQRIQPLPYKSKIKFILSVMLILLVVVWSAARVVLQQRNPDINSVAKVSLLKPVHTAINSSSTISNNGTQTKQTLLAVYIQEEDLRAQTQAPLQLEGEQSPASEPAPPLLQPPAALESAPSPSPGQSSIPLMMVILQQEKRGAAGQQLRVALAGLRAVLRPLKEALLQLRARAVDWIDSVVVRLFRSYTQV